MMLFVMVHRRFSWRVMIRVAQRWHAYGSAGIV
jgi:hypothetical protein